MESFRSIQYIENKNFKTEKKFKNPSKGSNLVYP